MFRSFLGVIFGVFVSSSMTSFPHSVTTLVLLAPLWSIYAQSLPETLLLRLRLLRSRLQSHGPSTEVPSGLSAPGVAPSFEKSELLSRPRSRRSGFRYEESALPKDPLLSVPHRACLGSKSSKGRSHSLSSLWAVLFPHPHRCFSGVESI